MVKDEELKDIGVNDGVEYFRHRTRGCWLPPHFEKCGGKTWTLSKKFYVVINCSNARDAEFAYK